MKVHFIFISFFLLSTTIYSQTIINAESIINEVDSTFYSLTLTYNGTKGNSNTNEFKIAPTIVLLRKKNEYKLLGGYSSLFNSGQGILNSGFIHIRHNYKLSKRLKTFEFFQIQFNDVLLLNKREIYGGGLRLNFVNRNAKDTLHFDMEFGLMYEKEVLNKTTLLPNEASISKVLRITYVNSFKWKINKLIKLNNVLYYQPRINNFADFRILNDFILGISLNKYFTFITSFTARYDNQPPGILKKFDSETTIGLNLKITPK